MRTFGPERLPALARGFSLLGSGGGGATTMLELMVQSAPVWPATAHATDELDPATPCVAVAFAGSTYLLAERLPGSDVFGPLVTAAERWTGVRAAAVCALEGAGMNGLTPLLLADRLPLVDADLMGRALPRLDQVSLLVDALPGVVVVCDTGGGVVVIDTQRPADVESQVRSAIVQAGGGGAVLVAGFTVGDLAEHAVLGTFGRALALGENSGDRAASPARLAADIEGRLLGSGRVSAIVPLPDDPYVSAIQLDADDGSLLRLVARSELLAVVRDGETTAASPEIIVALDSLSRDVLQVDGVTLARHVTVIALPAPEWWTRSPERRSRVTPAAFGLAGLEGAA
ncbi:hypothetical protein LLS1_35600 [Leifsonia sp. LS1]|uniref:S-methyl thiohydantoin desulfurase domain-containing protein n=1 Tax=Leifsonia sp. LS1 TaxID=2828483 RepID=UPI001CFCBDC0|nr:DUF917 family protein [Leifsonia sp. LS1]GIT81891.1 hypothetical protein LLS1_35600 [Leifsonia sp. LS1]